MVTKYRIYKLFFLLITFSAAVYGESFRVRKLFPVKVSGSDTAERFYTDEVLERLRIQPTLFSEKNTAGLTGKLSF